MSEQTGGRKLYVGNLPFSTDDDELRQEFEAQGFEVLEAKTILDRETKKPRGFGFVTIAADQFEAALELDMEIDGRKLKISEAQERAPRTDSTPGRSPQFGSSRR